MNSLEVFYLHIQGEQRGPYTIPQIDHMLHSGIISEDTLYWREGLDQWQPVTSLVIRRKRKNPWIKPAIALAVLLALASIARVFGPITMTGWRETNQHDFTRTAAYWRARDTVRQQTHSDSTLVEFHDLAQAHVEMQPPASALVLLRGQAIDSRGTARDAMWRVRLKFDPHAREWTAIAAQEIATTP